MTSPKTALTNLLKQEDIVINGSRDEDIQVHNEKFYPRVLSGGSLALGESYMEGWWDCKSLDKFFTKILRARLNKKVKPLSMIIPAIKAKLTNLQSKSRAFQVGEQHYDVGNELYEKMLDKRMVYTCGYWKNANTLNEAQEDKLDLVCKKIELKKGQKILDIGCGWGSFAKFAAEKYGAKVVGITISKEQVKLAKERCKNLPVEIRLQDYRDVNEKFDHIISLGMFEHVGVKNYKTYMEIANKNLKPEGLFLLHTIGNRDPEYRPDPWITKYIFPNSMTPSVKQIAAASEGLFILEDWHNFGPYYDKTLLAWHANFNKSWDEIKDKYNEKFFRMWNYYLLLSAAAFRSRSAQLWQIVLSKGNNGNIYNSIR